MMTTEKVSTEEVHLAGVHLARRAELSDVELKETAERLASCGVACAALRGTCTWLGVTAALAPTGCGRSDGVCCRCGDKALTKETPSAAAVAAVLRPRTESKVCVGPANDTEWVSLPFGSWYVFELCVYFSWCNAPSF